MREIMQRRLINLTLFSRVWQCGGEACVAIQTADGCEEGGWVCSTPPGGTQWSSAGG